MLESSDIRLICFSKQASIPETFDEYQEENFG